MCSGEDDREAVDQGAVDRPYKKARAAVRPELVEGAAGFLRTGLSKGRFGLLQEPHTSSCFLKFY